jgi:putative heme-binding domain-containing protein
MKTSPTPYRIAAKSAQRPLCYVCVSFLALAALAPLARAADEPPPPPDRITIAIEALKRLKDVDPEKNPSVKAVLNKVLEATKGTPQFVEIVRDFNLKGQEPALLDIVIKNPSSSAAAEATRLLLDTPEPLLKSLNGADAAAAAKLAEALGNSSDKRAVPLLTPIVLEPGGAAPLRQQAVRSLAQIKEGAEALLKIAGDQKLSADLKLTASTALGLIPWPELHAKAAEVLPPPQAQGGQLPPISQLVKMKGDAAHGSEVFNVCTVCHRVGDRGIDFGPNLSEIGTKLGKDALCEAILSPSAGIVVGYEGWNIKLKSGDEITGLIVSETENELSVKTLGGVITRYKKSDVVSREKMSQSLMPEGLTASMTTQDFVDLIEYLSALKRK